MVKWFDVHSLFRDILFSVTGRPIGERAPDGVRLRIGRFISDHSGVIAILPKARRH